MSSKLRSTTAALALAALFTTSAAQALPLSFQGPRGEGLLEVAWGWLSSLFPSKAGGMMDPNGVTVESGGPTSPNGSSLDAGGMMDPNGVR